MPSRDKSYKLHNSSLQRLSVHLPDTSNLVVTTTPKPDKDISQDTSYRLITLLCPSVKILEDTTLAFHKHEYVATMVIKRNNIIKVLAGTSWTLLTYIALGR